MNFIKFQKYIFLVSWSLLFLSGCVSVDPRASTEKVDAEATSTLKGVFENKSDYQSQGVYKGKDTLAEALGLYSAKNATDVEINLEEKKTLHIKFFLDGKVLQSKEYGIGTDFKFGDDGKIEIKQSREGGLDPHGGVGYGQRNNALFINAAGDLVCIDSGGGAGLIFLVLPVAMYEKQMTIHHKLVR